MGIDTAVDYATDWQAWHDAREARLRDPHGFLAVTGLHWVTERPQRYRDVPGLWSQGPEGVVVALADDESLVLADRALHGRAVIGAVDVDGVTAAFGDSVVEVAERFGRVILRPRHPDSPTLGSYSGTPAYDPDPSWLITGRLEAYDPARPVDVRTVVEGLGSTMEALGEVVFAAEGRPQRLVAFSDEEGLWLLFTDETSGVTTYAAGRQLAADLPGPDGSVVLDFNRTVNLPCAYTDFATCPLPPARNHVDVLVEAGEKVPLGR